jgi:hypothetical protein
MGRYIGKFVEKSIHLCGTAIHPEYLKQSIKDVDKMLIVTTQKKLNTFVLRSQKEYVNFTQILGFALVSEKNPKTYYINLICGSGIAKHIIGKLESLAKAENKTMITLSAIPTAMLAYYKRYGFKFAHDSCVQTRNLEIYVEGKLGEMRDLEAVDRLSNRRMLKIIGDISLYLSRKQIVYKKGCKHKRDMSVKERRGMTVNDCDDYGYEMTKCL